MNRLCNSSSTGLPCSAVPWAVYANSFARDRHTIAIICLVVTLVSNPSHASEGGLAQCRQTLLAFRAQHDRAPTDVDFVEIVSRAGSQLNGKDKQALWQEMNNIQRPRISAHDLAELTKSKRAFLHDMQQQYKVNRQDFDLHGQQTGASERRYTFMFAANKVLLSAKAETDQAKLFSVTRSYDGQLLRLVHYPGDKTPYASINKLNSRHDFYRTGNVLVASMLLNTAIDWDSPHGFYDLVFLIEKQQAIVLETAELVNGSSCVVLTDTSCRVYLDPTRDFAVVKVEEFGVARDNAKVISRFVTGTRELSDFKDYGNSLWLPSTVVQTDFNSGKVVSCETTTLETAKVNARISDDVFTNVIPDNAVVFDGTNQTVYRYGRSPSIEGTLWETVEQQSKVKKYAFVWLNIAAILALAITVISRRVSEFRRPSHVH